jgi:hypothetical protein
MRLFMEWIGGAIYTQRTGMQTELGSFFSTIRPGIFECSERSGVQTNKMKSYAAGLWALTVAVLVSGCETPYGTPDRTGTGALAGGAIGAFSGAVIGGRHAGEGALIGGAIGAITGGLIGHSMDQEEQERLRASAPQTYDRVEQGQPLAVADV